MTTIVVATHIIVKRLTKMVEEHGYKQYMYKCYFSPDLFDLTKHKVNCCRAV